MDTASIGTWRGPNESVGATWGASEFSIDLNNVREGDRAVSLIGSDRPQRVPMPGDSAVVIDEDGSTYDAIVETVLPDSRVYLRVRWESKRPAAPPLVKTYGRPGFGWGRSDAIAAT